jgi:hypothetical protein
MSRFEELRQQLTQAVLSDDIALKERARQAVQSPGFYDGFTDDELFVLKTISGDVHRTLLEVSLERANLQSA